LFAAVCWLWGTSACPALAGGSLPDLVATYFRAAGDQERAGMVRRIEACEGFSIAALQNAVLEVNIWPTAESRNISFLFSADKEPGTEVSVRLPEKYTTQRRWPTIIALHGSGGQAQDMLQTTEELLGAQAEEFIIVAPQSLPGGWFHSTPEQAGLPTRLLIELRKRFRMDNDRVYLTGYSRGAHEVCMIAMMAADRWAAAVPVAGTLYLPLPFRLDFYPDLLPNLRHLPILLCWGANDTDADSGKPSTGGGIARLNREFSVAARNAGIPLTPIEVPDVGHEGVLPPADKLKEFLAKERTKDPRLVSHWFRYPVQGRAYWLRLTRFLGEPWTGTKAKVQVKTGQEHRRAAVEALRKKFGYLVGSIEGQSIVIRTQHVAEAELLLNDSLVSLDAPVLVTVNDREVYNGPLKRRAAVMLETAASDYDFQRLYSVRLKLPYRRPATEE
jgi:poly(3-hydroxybutyrate) depolymerase